MTEKHRFARIIAKYEDIPMDRIPVSPSNRICSQCFRKTIFERIFSFYVLFEAMEEFPAQPYRNQQMQLAVNNYLQAAFKLEKPRL